MVVDPVLSVLASLAFLDVLDGGILLLQDPISWLVQFFDDAARRSNISNLGWPFFTAVLLFFGSIIAITAGSYLVLWKWGFGLWIRMMQVVTWSIWTLRDVTVDLVARGVLRLHRGMLDAAHASRRWLMQRWRDVRGTAHSESELDTDSDSDSDFEEDVDDDRPLVPEDGPKPAGDGGVPVDADPTLEALRAIAQAPAIKAIEDGDHEQLRPGDRHYLQVRPTTAPTPIGSFERQYTSIRSNLGKRSEPLELLYMSLGPEEPIHALIGGPASVLGQLESVYDGFKTEHVSTHPGRLLVTGALATDASGPAPEGSVIGSAISAPGGLAMAIPDAVSGLDESISSDGTPLTDGGRGVVRDNAGDREIDWGNDRPERDVNWTNDRAVSDNIERVTDDRERSGSTDELSGIDPPEPDPASISGPGGWKGLMQSAGYDPVVYEVGTFGLRSKEWLTLAALLDPETFNGESSSGRTVPADVGLQRVGASVFPVALQVVAKPYRISKETTDYRLGRLATFNDTIKQRFGGQPFGVSPEKERAKEYKHKHHPEAPFELSGEQGTRYNQIADRIRADAFVVSVRLVGTPTETVSRAEVRDHLEYIWEGLQGLSGDFYQLRHPPTFRNRLLADGSLDHICTARARSHVQFSRFLRRKVSTPFLVGHSKRLNPRRKWRNLIAKHPHELASLMLVPSMNAVSERTRKCFEYEEEHTADRPSLTPEELRTYTGEGIEHYYPVDNYGRPLIDTPLVQRIKELIYHLAEIGERGTGKSTNMAKRAAQTPDVTEGPTFVFAGRGGPLADYIMRAYAHRQGVASGTDGLDALRERVYWFDMPEIMPAMTFFDSRGIDERTGLRKRAYVVNQFATHYVGLMDALWPILGGRGDAGGDRSARLVKDLIRASFDEEYWHENAPKRASPDYCRHWHIEEMRNAMVGAINDISTRPRSSRSDIDERIAGVYQYSAHTRDNILGGAQSRLGLVGEDPHLQALMDNTDRKFAFEDILETNDIYLFDVSGLDERSQQALVLLFLTRLEMALKRRRDWLQERPDNYTINVYIDEASSVAGFEYFINMLEAGRNYRIALDMAMQFAEQLSDDDGGPLIDKSVLNLFSNVGQLITGTVHMTDEFAKRLCPPEKDLKTFRAQVRDLEHDKRLIEMPARDTKPRPQLITAHRGPLLPWHPASDEEPAFDEADYREAVEDVRMRTQEKYGIPADEFREHFAKAVSLPEDLAETLGLSTATEIDAALALMVAHTQVAAAANTDTGSVSGVGSDSLVAANGAGGVATPNPWIDPKGAVTRLLGWYERVDVEDEDLPPKNELTHHLFNSAYIETGLALDIDEVDHEDGVMVRLTDLGVTRVADLEDTGLFGSAGSAEHDARLVRLLRVLLAAGFEVVALDQELQSKPDARGFHLATGTDIVVEIEHSTITHPDKVLTNLQRAQQEGILPIFGVGPGDPDSGQDDTHWAEAIERILSSPVNEERGDETMFYNYTNERISFDGGAIQGGTTAVRPVTGEDDSRRSVWVRRDGRYVLYDGSGTKHAEVEDVESVSHHQFPAKYTCDHNSGQYVVHETGGGTIYYDSKEEFQEKWVPIKKPFVPENALPVPDYDQGTYAILIVHGDRSAGADPVLWFDPEERAVESLSSLVAALEEGKLQPAWNQNQVVASSDHESDSPDHPPDTENDQVESSHVGDEAIPDNSETVTGSRDGTETPAHSDVDSDEDGDAPVEDDLTPKQLGVREFASLLEGVDPDAIDEFASQELTPEAFDDVLRSKAVFALYHIVQTSREVPVYAQPAHFASQLNEERGFVSKQARDPSDPEQRPTYWFGLSWIPEVKTVATNLIELLEDTEDDLTDLDVERVLENERVDVYVDLLVANLSQPD